MDKKDLIKKGNFVKETKEKLQKDYKFVYKCNKCKRFYGSDKKENEKYLCPICEIK